MTGDVIWRVWVDEDEKDAFEAATARSAYHAVLRWSTFIRVPLVAAAVALTLTYAPGDRVRVLVQCSPMVIGVLLSVVHAWEELLGRAGVGSPGEVSDRSPVTAVRTRVVDHLWNTANSGQADLDLPGVLEGVGVLLAAAMVVGPWPVGLPVEAASTVAVLLSGYATCVWINICLHESFWKSNGIAGPSLSWLGRWERHLQMAVAPILAVVVDLWVLAALAAGIEFRVGSTVAAMALPWLVFPVVGMARAYTRAARTTFAVALSAQRKWSEDAVHELNVTIKEIPAALGEADTGGDSVDVGRALSMAVNLRQNLWPDAMSKVSTPMSATVAHDIAAMAQFSAYRVPVDKGRVMLRCTDAAAEVVVSGGDWRVAGMVLSNLLANAMVVASTVTVDASRTVTAGFVTFRITVSDDGPGFDPSVVMSSPRSSLRALRQYLREQEVNGDLTVTTGPGAGTGVIATWQSRDVFERVGPAITEAQR